MSSPEKKWYVLRAIGGKEKKAKEPKEIFWIDGANHQELFDLDKYVDPAVEKLANFYSKNLS